MRIWTDDEVDQLVFELKEIKNRAIEESVKKAVIPLLAENETLKIDVQTNEWYKKYFYISVGVSAIIGVGIGIIVGMIFK